MITPTQDTVIRELGQYLLEGLNTAGEAYEVQVVRGLAVNTATPYRNFPLLGVYRAGSTGENLEISTIEIIYYLGALTDLNQLEGIFRWVELTIMKLLFAYMQEKFQCLKMTGRSPSSQYRIVRTHDNLLIPQLRLKIEVQDNHLT